MSYDGSENIKTLNGVGPARAAAFAKLGVKTVDDLLRFYPRAYEDRGNIRQLMESTDGEKTALCLTVATSPKKALIRRGMSLLKFRAYDDSATAEITYFNQDYLADKIRIGETYRFYGRIERKKTASGKDVFSLSSPVCEPIRESVYELPPLVPIYPLTEGLTQSTVSRTVHEALSLYSTSLSADIIPREVLVANELCPASSAMKNIHAPTSMTALEAAKKRLIFEEFFLFALGLSLGRTSREDKGASICSENDISDLIALLPYKLTGAQSRAIEEISRDMAREVPMHRILVGDVGCGKTICAAAAMLIAVKSGKQAALMVPTEILANQHFCDLEPLFSKLGIKVKLLTGSCSASQKKAIYASISEKAPEKRTDIVIGTHALISEGVCFSDLGLVVTDEQHRFGVRQREALSEKGSHTHTLVMSATPIPRSLALTLYGDLDLSLIDELPPGRQRVDTFAVDEAYRTRLNAFIQKITDDGGQVYVVCPAIEEKEEEDDALSEGEIDIRNIGMLTLFDTKKETPPLKSAVKYTSELKDIFPDKKIAFVHGKMKAAEKDAVMEAFSSGEIDVLVSTTVIEVGVNVPRASLMIVENAERFGLSQLHQLRGRVGRGTRKSYCVLVSESKGESARKRLETMKTTYDGFTIAEKDLAIRGPGDFLGTLGANGIRQSGELRFRLADMCNDTELLKSAFRCARELISSDGDLSEHPETRKAVENMFKTEALS
ncbi:MAG: ATP-dependent DNA helicase RecG [Clostridia bacterium]|nr:ATP-dependent DNA helicase RecG [Clostridia bacterium]